MREFGKYRDYARESSMRLVSTDAERLTFRGRQPMRGAFLIGIAFIGVSLGPWFYAAAPSSSVIATSVIAAIISALFLRAGWPTVRQVVLDTREGMLKSKSEQHALEDSPGFHLESDLDEDGLPRYRAALELSTGRRVTLIEHADPELVLRDVAALLGRVDLPVSFGWGLPAGSKPWRTSEARTGEALVQPAEPLTLDISMPEIPSQREIGWTVIIGGGVVATIALFQVGVRLAHGDRPIVLDIALPLLLVATILTVGLTVLTRTTRLTKNGSLTLERRVFGIVRKRCVVSKKALRAAYPIGPEGAPPTHVLIESDEGPLAFPCVQRPARDVVAAIERDPRDT